MSVSNFGRTRFVRAGRLATLGGGSLLLLAACGGASTASSAAPSANSSTGSQSAPADSSGHRMSGVNGQITGVTGDALQVQSSTGQQTVSWTSSTSLVQLVSATQSDLAVGKCVQVRDPAAAADPTQAVTADSVVISDAVNGTCMRGLGGGGRGGGGAGGAPAAGRARGAVRGIVASISGNTMTVNPVAPAGASAAPDTTARTVTLSPSTAYTQVGPATAADLTVGKCVTAVGTPAQTIIVRPANGNTCGGGSAAAPVAPAASGDASGTASAAPTDNSSNSTAPADSSTQTAGN